MNLLKRMILPTFLILGLSGCQLATPFKASSVEPSSTPIPPVTVTPTWTLTPTITMVPPTSTPQIPVIEATNAAQLHPVGEAALKSPARIWWSKDSRRIGVWTEGGLSVLDAESLASEATVILEEPFVLLDFAPDPMLMAVTADQKEVQLREVLSGKVVRSLTPDSQVMSACFAPDGQTLALSMADEIAVSLWDVQSGKLLRTVRGFETAAPVYQALFSPDGQYLVWLARGSVQLQDLSSEKLLPALSHEDFVASLALDLKLPLLAASAGATIGNDFVPVIYLWNPLTGQSIDRLPTGQNVATGLAISPNGQVLASGAGNQIVLWNLASRQNLASFSAHTDRVNGLAFSPDGKTLASTSSDGTLRLWKIGS